MRKDYSKSGYILFLKNRKTGRPIRIGLYESSLACYKAYEGFKKVYELIRIGHSSEESAKTLEEKKLAAR
ncbi:hypothetical protein P4644_16120 [Priestia aryabhattai]|uniref:hypothetical protein n=1 Tax=Priestia aryabhattai TaxID=412384 RepID=UPI002E1C599D|nr:hypothetical protein [Priestia aryabhattai]